MPSYSKAESRAVFERTKRKRIVPLRIREYQKGAAILPLVLLSMSTRPTASTPIPTIIELFTLTQD